MKDWPELKVEFKQADEPAPERVIGAPIFGDGVLEDIVEMAGFEFGSDEHAKLVLEDMKTWQDGKYWDRIQNEGSGNW